MEGTPFGRYRLIELLGRGGMGEVWRAFDTDTDRIVAIKVLPEHLAQDDTFVQRFRREAHAAAQLDSPHVIPIHKYGEIDGRLYVDMRLIKGRDLQTVLADGPLEPGRAVRIIEQVAKALNAAHEIGSVHRAVKPSNILLDQDDLAYLIDFGIARAAGETSLTHTGGFIGSWPYMAPERFSTQEADARADVYALACVLYECLTGHTPYPGDSLEQQYAGHVATPPPQPSSTNPDLPADFDRVTEKGMAKDPDNRYATTVELADAAHDAVMTPLASPSEPTLLDEQPPPAPGGGRVEHPDRAAVHRLQQSLRCGGGHCRHPLSVQRHDERPAVTWIALAGLVIAALLAVVGLPHVDLHGPLHHVGVKDPLSGGTRSVYLTLHGQLRDAVRYNPPGPVLVAAALAQIIRAAIGWSTGQWLNLHVPRRLLTPLAFVATVVLDVNEQLHAASLTQPWTGP